MVLALGEVVKVSVLLTDASLASQSSVCLLCRVSVCLCIYLFSAPILFISHRQSTASENVSANNVGGASARRDERGGETAPPAATTESPSPALEADKRIQIKELFCSCRCLGSPQPSAHCTVKCASSISHLYICQCSSLSKRPTLPCRL